MANEVQILLTKAANAEKSEDAMRFSQAACNAANALLTFGNIPKKGINEIIMGARQRVANALLTFGNIPKKGINEIIMGARQRVIEGKRKV